MDTKLFNTNRAKKGIPIKERGGRVNILQHTFPCKDKNTDNPGKWWAVKFVGDEMIITKKKKKKGRTGGVDFSQSHQSLSTSRVPLCIQISDANGH